MSVPKSKRGESHMMVVTKANELASYTIHICSSEKNFPKRYRWCLTSKIVDASTDICNYVNMANNVYVNNQMTADLRSEYQSRALVSTHSLLTMMNIAYQEFDIGHGPVLQETLDGGKLMFGYKTKDDQLAEARSENEKLLSLLEKANANIDYLSMMSDIDLDNEEEEVEDEAQQEV